MLSWHKCYKEGWGKEIVPEAYGHPAKFARGLIRRIYEYALERGYLKEGAVVIDPFAGVALGGLDASRMGLHWIGIELEERFVLLSNQNFLKWAEREWCTCEENGQSYLRQLRETISTQRNGSNLQREEGDDEDILQPRLLEIEPEFSEKGGTKPKLEGRQICQQTGLCDDKSKWKTNAGAQAYNATTSRSPAYKGRGNPPQEWEPSGQQNGESSADDDFGTHAFASSEGSNQENNREDLHNLRQDIHGQTSYPSMQRGMQKDQATGILAQIRRKKEGKYCRDCGKLIVAFPVILQGDSRRLCEVLEGARAEGIISSPPWSSVQIHDDKNFIRIDSRSRYRDTKWEFRAVSEETASAQDGYGTDPAQLGNMPAGEPPQVEGIIASPPYAGDVIKPRSSHLEADRLASKGKTDMPYGMMKGQLAHESYGQSDGQLAAMREGEPPAGIVQVDACVSSPPYEGSISRDGRGTNLKIHKQLEEKYHRTFTERSFPKETYGDASGQLGMESGNTFWAAAKAILLQCHQVLAPGGVAIFVCKRFVRDKKIVEFSQQWADLCQSCGFELIEWIKAWLVEERGTQYDLEGEAHTKTIKRFSFFRRLHAQKYPHLAIEWEDVLIFRKPMVPKSY